MRVGAGEHTYEWIDGWARIPDSEGARTGWAHHGMAVTRAGEIVAFHPGESTMLVFDRAGVLQRSWATGLTEAHGITIVEEGGIEQLWIADQGSKRVPPSGYQYQSGRQGWQVARMDFDGRVSLSLDVPPLSVYAAGKYAPTWVAVNEKRHGGNGDAWVTDGYGQSHVHRFDQTGAYRGSITGQEGDGGAFDCPHCIWIDRRKSEPELYVADRGNRRVQVYDLDGQFKRVFGSDFLTSPSGFAQLGDCLVIAELRARLTIVDVDDHLVCHLGDNEGVCGMDGWPNAKNERGEIVRTSRLETGKFNSPHGIAADGDGNIYVSEWLIGGRYTKLAKV